MSLRMTSSISAAREDTWNTHHPEMEKSCFRKMMLFRKAIFLATAFPKIIKNSFARFSIIKADVPRYERTVVIM